jgi:hypothetical protein
MVSGTAFAFESSSGDWRSSSDHTNSFPRFSSSVSPQPFPRFPPNYGRPSTSLPLPFCLERRGRLNRRRRFFFQPSRRNRQVDCELTGIDGTSVRTYVVVPNACRCGDVTAGWPKIFSSRPFFSFKLACSSGELPARFGRALSRCLQLLLLLLLESLLLLPLLLESHCCLSSALPLSSFTVANPGGSSPTGKGRVPPA